MTSVRQSLKILWRTRIVGRIIVQSNQLPIPPDYNWVLDPMDITKLNTNKKLVNRVLVDMITNRADQ